MLHQTHLPVTLKKTTTKITPRAGLILIEKVAQELQMEQLLGLHFGGLKKRKRGLPVSRQIMDVAALLIDGGERIEDIRQFRGDEGWQKLREEDNVMAPRTALDLLHRFDNARVARFELMERQFNHRISKKVEESRIATIDADATFIEDHKEESRISYHGRPGYYPMLGFWA